MEGAEVGIAISPQDTQRRRDGASAWRQDGAGEQQRNVRPGRAGEQVGETREPGKKAWRERIGGASWKTGVLHPRGRIAELIRGNLADVRQIESVISLILVATALIEHNNHHGQTRHNACPDRRSVHSSRRRQERQRLSDPRPQQSTPTCPAAPHSGYGSLGPLLSACQPTSERRGVASILCCD